MTRRPTWTAIAAIIIVAELALLLHAQQWQSVGYDEPELLYSGLRTLERGDYSISPHPPLTKLLAALPVWLVVDPELPADDPYDQVAPPDQPHPTLRIWKEPARAWLYRPGGPDAHALLRLARLPTLLLWAIAALAAYLWARELYRSEASGLLALGLTVTCPITLTAGQVVATDIGGVAFGTLGLYLATRALRRPTAGRLSLAGVAFGLALASRFQPVATTAMACGLVALLGWALPDPDSDPTVAHAGLYTRRRLRLPLLRACAIGAVALATLAAVYAIHGLPHFFAGIDFLRRRITPGHAMPYFLDGEVSLQGWFDYFPSALAYKLPPGHLVALLLAAVSLAIALPTRDEALVLVPSLILLALAVASRINYGVRHILPALIPLYVLAGRLARDSPRWVVGLLALLPLIGAVEQMRVHPWANSYASPLAGGPDNGWRHLADSSIDSGRGLLALADFTQQPDHQGGVMLAYFGAGQPHHYRIPYRYLVGMNDALRIDLEPAPDAGGAAPFPPAPPRWLAVSPAYLQMYGLTATAPGALHWLRDTPPDHRVGGGILVWDLASRPAWYGRLALVYAEVGQARNQAHRQQVLNERAQCLLRLARQHAPQSPRSTLAALEARAPKLPPLDDQGVTAGPGLVLQTVIMMVNAGYERGPLLPLVQRALEGRFGRMDPQLREAQGIPVWRQLGGRGAPPVEQPVGRPSSVR